MEGLESRAAVLLGPDLSVARDRPTVATHGSSLALPQLCVLAGTEGWWSCAPITPMLKRAERLGPFLVNRNETAMPTINRSVQGRIQTGRGEPAFHVPILSGSARADPAS